MALAFVALLAVDSALGWLGIASGLADLITVALIILGIILAVRFLRHTLRQAIWRLRNRLIVTYLFIAVVPILLIVALVAVGTWMVVGQIAVYLVGSELERRASTLEGPAQFLAQARPADRPSMLRQMAPMIESGLPGFQAAETGEQVLHYPDGNKLAPPEGARKSRTGFVWKDGQFYCFSLAVAPNEASRVLLMAPINTPLLGKLVPGVGLVYLSNGFDDLGRITSNDGKTQINVHLGDAIQSSRPVGGRIPTARSAIDLPTVWGERIPFITWDKAWDKAEARQTGLLVIQTRPSAVLSVLFNTQSEDAQLWQAIFAIIAGLLLIAWIVSVVIGVSLTRTITRAVHGLYEGTTKIATGDFGYRIPVHGKDQLAALGTSFNNMTTQLQSLVKVAKEKERLQSEVEIASEVQNQLFPRSAPSMRTIELFGACHPARTVSGDYYDYLCLPNGNLAVAIGDVAGKGISAALLMASIQSIMRTQLAAGGDSGVFSASRLVAQLNRQLYASTAPEKYATFFFGVYDESSRVLTYTNAGHLPPLLLHGGEVSLLDVTGTVVGLFPSMAYQEQSVKIESGDLLVAYTDGITEPENDYGEEFGTDRLAEVAQRQRGAEPCETVRKIMEAVTHWSTAPELPDDMTVVIARGLA